MALKVGDHVGSYEVKGQLGAGGMGIVLRARDTKLERDVALKVLPQAFAEDPERVVRFQREAKILASLNHPNIATIHGLEDAAGTTALVLELVEGPTLADRIEQSPLTVDDALPIARQIGAALKAAHDQGIIHRDLKPSNIKLKQDGTVKVLDFGLAKGIATGPEGAARSQAQTVTASGTVQGVIVGTPAYMSPEQIRGEPLDTRVDIWAFGCVLYEALTGQRAFREKTAIETMAAILERGPDWNVLPVATPPRVEALMRRCLQREPGQRPSDVSDLGTEIAEAVGDSVPTPRSSPSIAVLPFANMSTDPEQEYFCEGLAEELIDALARLKGLHVVARTSSFQFKGQSQDLRRVGERLGVATVLEGSVRKAGNRIRINTQLINAADGYHLWSERFDRNLNDIFAVQDEIARSVVDELRVELLGGGQTPIVSRPTESLEAYTSYMQGRHQQHSRYDLAKAMRCYEQAVRHDPSYAAAWAGIADTAVSYAYLSLERAASGSEKAHAAVDRALALGGELSEAHAALGRVLCWCDWDWFGSERSFKRALAINPSNAQARVEYGSLLVFMGRTEEALAQIHQVRKMDPLSARALSRSGMIYLIAHRYEEGLSACREALELQPDLAGALWYLSLIYQCLGRHDEALSALRRVPDVVARTPIHMAFLGAALARLGNKREAESLLAQLKRRSASEYVAPYYPARVYIALGNIDDGVDQLTKGFDERSPGLVMLQTPFWDVVRDDARVQELMRQMRLPDLRAL